MKYYRSKWLYYLVNPEELQLRIGDWVLRLLDKYAAEHLSRLVDWLIWRLSEADDGNPEIEGEG